jgi:phosphatidylglycerol lysyltransferase
VAGGKAQHPSPDPVEPRLAALTRFGTDAVGFQGLESSIAWWHDDAPPAGTAAAQPYLDTGRSWIAVGRPLTAADTTAMAARRFAAAARARGRRAVFFGVEALDAFAGFRSLALGLQSVLLPAEWPATLRRSRKLREQLRRARAKGVSVRIVDAADLAPGIPLRHHVERLRAEWLGSRHMEAMTFLVAVEPFHAPAHHLYVVAERRGRPVQFLSAVPIPQARGWLFEDMLRGVDAPNGTTELVLDLALRTIAERAEWATPGLTPLAGGIARWLRVARAATSPLYDFDGLRRFRARLFPARWSTVWMVWDRGPAALVLLDVLRAFAGGRLAAFGIRSIVRHASGPPWAVAMPLVPWIGLLVGLLATGHAGALALSRPALAGWIVFDIVLAWLMFRAATRPRAPQLAALAIAAAADAAWSIQHLAHAGLGPSLPTAALRIVAVAGPIVGALGLAWASRLAHVVANRRILK